MGDSEQAQWDTLNVARNLVVTSNKIKLKRGEHKPHVIKEHNRIFPGVDVDILLTRSKHEQTDASTDDAVGKVFLSAHTWCTSLVFAWMSWCMTCGKRAATDRLKAFQLLTQSALYIVAALGGQASLKVTRCGDLVQTVVQLDASLTVPIKYLWTLDSFQKIENKWNQERISTNHPWITSYARNPTIIEYIAFCLEDSGNRRADIMQEFMLPAAANTMSALCDMVHANLPAVARRSIEPHDKFTEYKNRRQHTQSQNLRMCDCAMYLLHDSAPCIDLHRTIGLVISTESL